MDSLIRELEWHRLVARLSGHRLWVMFLGATIILVKMGVIR